MRLLFLTALVAASPAMAAPAPDASPREIPPALTDPALADQLGRVAGVLAKSLMNLPVGEVEAAIEGRPVTSADRVKTVRDSIGGPDTERRIEAQAVASGRTMQAAGKALVASLPAIMSALEAAEQQVEKAVANIPDPTYPRR